MIKVSHMFLFRHLVVISVQAHSYTDRGCNSLVAIGLNANLSMTCSKYWHNLLKIGIVLIQSWRALLKVEASMNIISWAKCDFFLFTSARCHIETWHETKKDKVNYPEDQLFLSGYGHTQLFNAIKCLLVCDIQDHCFVLLCLHSLLVHSVGATYSN